MEIEDPGKVALLEHYSTGDKHSFIQYDGWHAELPDYVIRGDDDDDCIMLGMTQELRHSPGDLAVRVLVHESADYAGVVRKLEKILNYLKATGENYEELQQAAREISQPRGVRVITRLDPKAYESMEGGSADL